MCVRFLFTVFFFRIARECIAPGICCCAAVRAITVMVLMRARKSAMLLLLCSAAISSADHRGNINSPAVMSQQIGSPVGPNTAHPVFTL